MASLKQLHELVHALNRDEKRFLSLTVQSVTGKARERYVKSLHILNLQKEFNNDKLKKKLGSGLQGMNLSEANSNLYNFITRALTAYYPLGHGNLGLLKELMWVELLISKGLFENAQKTLLPLKRKLKEGGSFAMMYRAYEQQNMINTQFHKASLDYPKRFNFIKERMDALNEHRLYLEIIELNTRFYELVQKIGEPRTKSQLQYYEKLRKSRVLNTTLDEVPSGAVSVYMTLRISLIQVLEGEQAAYDEGIKALVEFRRRFPGVEHSNVDYNVLDSLMVMSIYLRDYKSIEKTRMELVRVHKINPNKGVQQKIQAKMMMADLIVCISKKDFPRGLQLLKEWMSEKKKPLWIDAPLAYINFLLAARLYYLAGDPGKSLDYLLLLQAREKAMRPSLALSYRFLFLLCHYKLGNYQLLSYGTDALYKNLRRLDKLYLPEKALLQFVKRCGHFDRIKAELVKLATVFNELEKDPLNKSFFEFGDYREWLKMELSKGKN